MSLSNFAYFSGLDVPDSSVGNDSSVKPITCDDEVRVV